MPRGCMWRSLKKGCDNGRTRTAPLLLEERGRLQSLVSDTRWVSDTMSIRRRLGGDDLDADRERHRLVERCRRGVLADRLDRLVELERPAVEFDARLGVG